MFLTPTLLLLRMQNLSKNTVIILLLICGFSLCSLGQKNTKKTQRPKISCPEKRWAVFHPFIAKKSYNLTKETLQVTDSVKNSKILDGDINGGQVDAFKHAYWMALLSQNIKYKKALKLGKAHEKGNYKSFKKSLRKGFQTSQDQRSSEMDLWNNHRPRNDADKKLYRLCRRCDVRDTAWKHHGTDTGRNRF